jgi:hypothetical protein
MVKNHDAVKNIEHPEAWALAVLRELPGVREVVALPAGARADLEVTFRGHRRPALVEVKRHVDAAVAHAIIADAAAARPSPYIVVAGTTTAGARDLLAARGIGYTDVAGNASIELPGLIIRTGSFSASAVVVAPRPPATRLAGKAGLVAQALLLERGRAWKLGDLAEEAGVSSGLVHRVLTRLETVALVMAEGRGPAKVRRLVAPAALLDLWAEEDAEPNARRTTGYLLGTPGSPLAAIASARLDAAGIDHAVTGVAAAALAVPVLTSVAITQLRVTAALTAGDVLRVLDARPAEEGFNLQLVQGDDDLELRFRRRTAGVWMAAATRVYLDALRDPRRGREQAEAFREAVLGIER